MDSAVVQHLPDVFASGRVTCFGLRHATVKPKPYASDYRRGFHHVDHQQLGCKTVRKMLQEQFRKLGRACREKRLPNVNQTFEV